jgi:hypothetical protein
MITLHPGQSKIFNDLFVAKTVLNAVAICSRGFGKSHLGAVCGVAAVFELLELPASVPNKNVFLIGPTHSQVTDIYYPLLIYQLGMEQYAIKHSKDTGRIQFRNNVELRLISYEAIDRLRGLGAYCVVSDEVRDYTSGGGFKDAWESIISPCISTRWSPKQAKAVGAKSPGRSLTISTPKGYDHLFTMSNHQETDNTFKTYQFDHTQAPLLDQEEVLRIKQTTDPVKFAREYLASFSESGANVFYCFDRKVHVKKELEPFRIGTLENKGEDVWIGVDFNILIQASSAFAIRGTEVHFLEEFSGAADTETLAILIKAKFWPNFNKVGHLEYKKKVCKITVFPDPSGASRKTSAVIGVTDHSILEMHGFIVKSHKGHPAIVDSVACVNRLLLTATGKTSMYIAAKCTGIINSLERTSWLDKNSDTAVIDKKPGIEHFSDGIRYAIEYLFPINVGTKSTSRGFGF